MAMFDFMAREVEIVDLDADIEAVPDVFCDRCSSISNPKTFASYAELSAHRAAFHASSKSFGEAKQPILEFQLSVTRYYGGEDDESCIMEEEMIDATPWMVRRWYTDLRRHYNTAPEKRPPSMVSGRTAMLRPLD